MILEDHGKTFVDKIFIQKEYLTFEEVRDLLIQIKLVLMKVHELGHVHGDIKAANICYKNRDFTLIDWGNSFLINQPRFIGSIAHHQAPYSYWSSEVDIYALAVFAFQLLFRGEFLEFLVSQQFEKAEPYLPMNSSRRVKSFKFYL